MGDANIGEMAIRHARAHPSYLLGVTSSGSAYDGSPKYTLLNTHLKVYNLPCCYLEYERKTDGIPINQKDDFSY